MVCSTFYECPVFLGSLCTRGFQIVLIKCVGFTEDMGVLGGGEDSSNSSEYPIICFLR